MSSQIRFRDAAAPTDPDSDLLVRSENTINTPLVATATWLTNGQEIAGVYTITATSSNQVNIVADDPKNEHARTGVTVVADNTTVNEATLPGVGLVFSSSMVSGWQCKVTVGDLMAGDGSTTDRFAVGIVEGGTTSTQRKVVAVNVGTQTSAESKVYALPGRFIEGVGVELYVERLLNHTAIARQALATEADLVMTFEDYQAGPPETADVLIGGVLCIQDAILDGNELYQHGEGNGYVDAADLLKGLAVIFADTPGDPSAKTFDVHVRRGFDWFEFAPDVAGTPGTWTSGPLELTQIGQLAGEILAAGYATFWFRLVAPASASPGDMVMFVTRGRGLTV
jgi:hypothetical protein